MNRLMPPPVVGSLVGFIIGVLAHTGLPLWGLMTQGYRFLVLAVLGAVVGGIVGGCLRSSSHRVRGIARWCVGTATVVGGMAFLAGFVGPILLHPDLPQGPLLGIFITGPFGFIGGAILGAILGAIVQGLRRPVASGVTHR